MIHSPPHCIPSLYCGRESSLVSRTFPCMPEFGGSAITLISKGGNFYDPVLHESRGQGC